MPCGRKSRHCKSVPEFTGVTVGLTGTPVLEHEEMATSQRDIALATAISLVLTVILLLVAFRGLLNMVAAMVTLVVAICSLLRLCHRWRSATSTSSPSVFAIMLIGIGIEYGIQVVLRYQEELARGGQKLEALRIALARNVWAIVMAAATVAAAFITFVFTDFKGIAELGIIAAGGIVICVLVTFTILPAMLVLFPVRSPKPRPATAPEPRWQRLLFGSPRTVLAVASAISLLCLYPLARSEFDYNLMNLQARGLESVTYAYKLMRSRENAGYFAVVTADTKEAAAEKVRAAGEAADRRPRGLGRLLRSR